jgi:acetyltransferase-like isoleucine patch superfamily enzyme
MSIANRLIKIIPSAIRRFVRIELSHVIEKAKTPSMVWGYQDCNGVWCPRTRISDTTIMNHPERIRIGDNVFVGHYTILDGTGCLEIGEGAQLAAWNGIYTHSSHVAIRIYGNHYQEVPEQEKKGYPIKPVKIGKYVFIGAGAKILPGVNVGKGALISAGSIVTKNVGEFDIVSGNPAKIIGDTRNLDKPYLRDPKLFEWYNEWQKK